MHVEFDVDYFIKKFEAIPEERWRMGMYMQGDRHCALGHCGFGGYQQDGRFKETQEGFALKAVFNLAGTSKICAISVNDGHCEFYRQPTPKQRVLAALKDIKEKVA